MDKNEYTHKKPAVFLDQRGTIIDDSCKFQNYISVNSFFPGTFEALRKVQSDYLLFIVTNQSRVGLGLMSIEDAQKFNTSVKTVLENEGISIIKTYACMHKREDHCSCIKPNPYFLIKAQQEYNIDLKNSFVIGDHPHDMEFAQNAGSKGLYVLTGHGIRHRDELTGDFLIFNSVSDAADFVISNLQTC